MFRATNSKISTADGNNPDQGPFMVGTVRAPKRNGASRSHRDSRYRNLDARCGVVVTITADGGPAGEIRALID